MTHCNARLTTATVEPCPEPFTFMVNDGRTRTICGAAKPGCDGTTHTTTYTLTCDLDNDNHYSFSDGADDHMMPHPEDGYLLCWRDNWKGATPHVETQAGDA